MNENLCFIKLVGIEDGGYYRYEFFFTENLKNFEIVEDNYPCCLSETIEPIEFKSVGIVKTKIKFDLIQNNCCFSFNHSKLGIVALAWENIDELDKFPEDGRLFFYFGETYDDV